MAPSRRLVACILGLLLAVAIALLPAPVSAETRLQFMFPVGVAGRLAKLMTEIVDEFNRTHPGIKVEAVYSGGYDATMQKVQTAVQAGHPPDVAVTLVSDLATLVAMDAILPLDELVQREGGKAFLDQFFPVFLENSTLKGKFWGLPYQRSTPVLFWNKDLFAKAGLDPERAPQTWDELVQFGQKLTVRDASGQTKQWGVSMWSTFRDWWFSALVLQNGGNLITPDSRPRFNDPATIGAAQFLVDLVNKYQIMPPRPAGGKATPQFLSQTAAILYDSTGSLAFIQKSASFRWGTAFLPRGKQEAVPVGGGNIWIFRNIPKENQDAAWTFLKYITGAEPAARWSVGTGYVAVNKKSWDLPIMKEELTKVPQLSVAREQLKYAHPRWATLNFGEVQRVLNNRLEDAIDQTLTPKQAMEQAQAEADRLLKR